MTAVTRVLLDPVNQQLAHSDPLSPQTLPQVRVLGQSNIGRSLLANKAGVGVVYQGLVGRCPSAAMPSTASARLSPGRSPWSPGWASSVTPTLGSLCSTALGWQPTRRSPTCARSTSAMTSCLPNSVSRASTWRPDSSGRTSPPQGWTCLPWRADAPSSGEGGGGRDHGPAQSVRPDRRLRFWPAQGRPGLGRRVGTQDRGDGRGRHWRGSHGRSQHRRSPARTTAPGTRASPSRPVSGSLTGWAHPPHCSAASTAHRVLGTSQRTKRSRADDDAS